MGWQPSGPTASSLAAAASLTQLLSADSAPHTVGIMMTDTYGPGAQYVKLVKDWLYKDDAEQATTSLDKANRLRILFSNVSFVGPNSLASRLKDLGSTSTPLGSKAYTEDVYVSQVVPNYDSDDSDAAPPAAKTSPGWTRCRPLSTHSIRTGVRRSILRSATRWPSAITKCWSIASTARRW